MYILYIYIWSLPTPDGTLWLLSGNQTLQLEITYIYIYI